MAKKRLAKRKLESYKKLLVKRKRELLEQVLIHSGDGDVKGDQPADPLDMAGNSSLLELTTALGNHERNELAEIDSALEKIEDGVYGFCEESEEPINPARLEAMPTARYTLEVQARRELGSQAKERPRRRSPQKEDLPSTGDEDS